MGLNGLQDKISKMDKPTEPIRSVTPKKQEVDNIKKAIAAPIAAVADIVNSVSQTIQEKQKERKINDRVLNERSEGKSTYKNGKLVSIKCQQCGIGEMKKYAKRSGAIMQVFALLLLIFGFIFFLAGGFVLVFFALWINFHYKNIWRCNNCKCILPM